jgi:hypothetical protein
MSTGVIILVAVSTAAAVILVSLLVSRLVHTVVDTDSELAPERSPFRRLSGRRSSQAPLMTAPVYHPIAGLPRVEPIKETPVPADEESEPVLPAGEASRTPVAEEPAVEVAPHVPVRGSIDLEELSRATIEEGDRSAEHDAASYRQVGEEVMAVLTAAEQAAVLIRETALQEAGQTRRAAEEQGAAVAAEARADRAETERYSEETRAAAEAYAEETRRRADEEAARTVSQAEEQARLIRADAEQEASEVKSEAVRHRDALTTTIEGMEARIESMLGAFRRGTSELEELLPAERRSGTEARDGLERGSSEGEPSSHAAH